MRKILALPTHPFKKNHLKIPKVFREYVPQNVCKTKYFFPFAFYLLPTYHITQFYFLLKACSSCQTTNSSLNWINVSTIIIFLFPGSRSLSPHPQYSCTLTTRMCVSLMTICVSLELVCFDLEQFRWHWINDSATKIISSCHITGAFLVTL